MRFASIVVKDTPRRGVIDGEEIALLGLWPTLIDAIAADALSTITADDARDRVSIADAAWLLVIPTPGKILCVGPNHHRRVARFQAEAWTFHWWRWGSRG